MPMFSSFRPSLAFLPTTDGKKVSDLKSAADLQKKSRAGEHEKSTVKGSELVEKASPSSSPDKSPEHVKTSTVVKEGVKHSRLEEMKKLRAAKRASALKRVEDAKRAFAERIAEHHERRAEHHERRAEGHAKRSENHVKKATATKKLTDLKIPAPAMTAENLVRVTEAGTAAATMEFHRHLSHRETVDKLVMEEMQTPKMTEALKSPKSMPEHLQLDKVHSGKLRDTNQLNSMMFKRILQQQQFKQLQDGDEEKRRQRRLTGKVKTTFSSAANVVKRLIQLANFVRMNQGEAHLGVLVAEFLGRKESLPKGSDTVVSSCWDIAAADNFDVRGKSYLSDKSKVAAGEPRMKFIAAHWLKSDRREDNLAGRPGSVVEILEERLKEIQGYKPFFFVINLQVPGTTTHTLALYYMTYRSLEDDNLLHKFVDGDDEFRNARFKLIPHVTQGSWLVKRTVGSTPCLIGKALTINYHKGKSYIELDIDIGSSSVAKGVVGLVFGYLRNLVVEMGFVIQAENEEELPERLLGTCRLSYLDVNKAVAVKDKPEE